MVLKVCMHHALKIQKFPPVIKEEAFAMLILFCLYSISQNIHTIVEKENEVKRGYCF